MASLKLSASSSFGAILYERYERLELIGQGAYGIVYKILDRNTNQYKAMKVIKNIDQKSEKEFKNMMEINHENLVKYFDHFYHIIRFIEHICIVTEYCENGDLERRICQIKAEKKKFSEKEIFGWILQATNGLKYLHSVEMVHRDIKPENMLLSKTNTVKLADLGIAKVLSGTIARSYVGTMPYMSPELERCKDANKEEGITYSFSTDVWSLGCVLYELILLNKAFPQGFGAVKIIPSLTGCGNFTNILQKMLVTDPINRFSSKKLSDFMMKSSFDIKEQSSKEKEPQIEAKEKEQKERQEREAFARLKIAEENNKLGKHNDKKPSSSSSGSKNSTKTKFEERARRFQDPYIGEFLNDRYEVVKKIGKGSFGSVYLVEDTKIDNEVREKAMKIMDKFDLEAENELELSSIIFHENILRYFDHFHMNIEGENQTFLITEYCEKWYKQSKNGDLKKKIGEAQKLNKNFEDRQILDWICQATNALNYLHSKKPDPIIHRDIKPENMFLNGRNQIKIGDLGLSKLMDTISYASSHAGTPLYMSPEVFKGRVMDIKYYPNTDIWSLGCVLYELIFLTKAFPLGQRCDPPIPSDVFNTGIFSSILPKMLEKDCLVRITAEQLLIKLMDLLSDDY